MPDPLDDLRERLLRGGIAPAYVSRLVEELADHAADVEDHLVASGMTRGAARFAALHRLGAPADLAAPILADGRFRSWFSRMPALVFVAAPVLLQAALTILAAVVLRVTATRDVASLTPLAGTLSIALLIAPAAIAWWLTWSAHQRRLPPVWPLLGAAATAVAAAATQLSVGLPQASAQGHVAVALGLPDLLAVLAIALPALAPLTLFRVLEIRPHA